MLKAKMQRLEEAVLANMEHLVLGRTFYCMKSTDTRYQEFLKNHQPYADGTPRVYNSVVSAMSNTEAYDRVFVGPGVWTETASIHLTKYGVKLLGYMTSGSTWGQPSLKGSGTISSIVSIDAHNTEVAFLGIHQPVAYAGIRVTTTDNYWRTHVHDVYFGGNGVGTYGIVMGDTTVGGGAFGQTTDAPCTVVERCHFDQWATASVFFNCGYGSKVQDCTLAVSANASGIIYYTDSTSRPHAYILDNRFNAVSATTSTGITVTNTPTAGYLMIDGNHFVNFGSDNLCITKRTGYTGLNYLGITAIAIT